LERTENHRSRRLRCRSPDLVGNGDVGCGIESPVLIPIALLTALCAPASKLKP
jgi:hypothetical protein